MPVLPEVESRITLPGRSSPRSSPTSIILRAARSLTDPPGLKPSSFARIRTPGRSRPAVSRVISSIGVLPISSSTLPARAIGTIVRLASAGDGWDDRDVVAILDLRFKLAQETDIVAVQIDIYEAPQFALFVEQALRNTWMVPFEVLNDRLDRITAGRYFVAPRGETAERRRHSNPD